MILLATNFRLKLFKSSVVVSALCYLVFPGVNSERTFDLPYHKSGIHFGRVIGS